MPTVSLYIRNEDLAAWNALKHKSQWIHDNLAGHGAPRSKGTPKEPTVPPRTGLENLEMDNKKVPLHAAQTEVAVPMAADKVEQGIPAISQPTSTHQTSNPPQPKKVKKLRRRSDLI